MLSSFTQDIRFALRGLRARPGFSLTILLTLALGIGANAAIFSVVDSVLLRPLPFAEPTRLVHLWETYKSNVDGRSEASFPDYLDWKARNTVFTDIGGYQGAGLLLGGDQPASIGGAKATANFFDVLGVHAAFGRTFLPGEDAVGAPKVAVLSYGFWQRQFAGKSSVVGSTITLNGAPTTIVGVLPREFVFARQANADVWTPIDRSESARANRGNHWLNIVARLKPGVSTELAARDMSAIMRNLAEEYRDTNAGRDAQIVPLHDELVGSVRPILILLYGAVLVVLLIACVNVANLLLIRGADRQREIAVRIALGAGRPRLMRQFLTESVLLAIIGGALGVGVAALGVRALVSLIPAQQMRGLPPLAGAGLDPRIIAYAIAISIVAGVSFGIAPALGLLAPRMHDALKSGARGSTAGANRLRSTLVAGEIALTMILLSGATLFARSVMQLLAINPGFRVERLLTTTVVLPSTRYADPAAQADAFRRFEIQAREIPGVESVGLVTKLPLDFGNSMSFAIAGQPAPDPSDRPSASYRQANADYFKTMGIPLLDGRAFNIGDDRSAPLVIVVNRALAKLYFGNRNPVGQRILSGSGQAEIVGLVGDVPIGKIEDRIPPTIYFAFEQSPQTSASVALRTSADAGQIARGLRRALSSVDASAALTAVRPMDDLILDSPSVFIRRFPLYLIGAFAATALVLAIVGIYGVVSYSVSQRTREMGIRMALGAQPGSLVALVVRHGLWIAAAGIVLGVAGALLASRFAEKMLYGVSASDPVTYVGVATLLASVAIAASVLPARRASRVDPVLALRAE